MSAAASPALAQGFLDFVRKAPSPFHAVAEARTRLERAGFCALSERDTWDLKRGGKYFLTRNASSIVAFVVGEQYQPGNGFGMVAAHTDSPCLKLKPVSRKPAKCGYLQIGVQTYGGGLWHTWFDRDLGLAGRVVVDDPAGPAKAQLVLIDKPVLRVPTLAIHLDREVREGFKFNPETHLTPVLCLEGTAAEGDAHHGATLLNMLAAQLGVDPAHIRDVELCLFDVVPPTVGGARNEFVFAPRCDNLAMSFTALSALLNHAQDSAAVAASDHVSLVALFDNEEVGSLSAYGADSHMLESVLHRISSSFSTGTDIFERAVQRSYLISADMAHAVHPNYADKHDEQHRPRMNRGVVIKHNANQRYATTAPTAALLRRVARLAGTELQDFVVRNDSPCGSTIGPILSGKLGLRTIDVGNPQLSMHSIREMAGVDDFEHATKLFAAFFKEFARVDKDILVD